MSTFLFDKIVFGPVKSRRLGVSLGINLLPLTRKLCNFDCVYCECGLNSSETDSTMVLPTRKEVYEALETRLQQMVQSGEQPDVITFAGNGEPTMHPQFSEIIEDTIALRNTYFTSAFISVLSNSTMLHKSSVVEALRRVDQNIMKLDAGLLSTIEKINKPVGNYNLDKITAQLRQFDSKLIIQSMFTRGNVDGIWVDNTTDNDLKAWVKIIEIIRPRKVMIYTIDRDTPFEGLEKIGRKELDTIGKRIELLGIEVQISG